MLSPQAETVEVAIDTPSENAYSLLGNVTAEAAGVTSDEAETSARNDLRNQAAAMGASLLVIDEDNDAMIPYANRQKVTITARAFKLIE